MNLVLFLFLLNAQPVSTLPQAPTVTVRKPYTSQAEYYARVCSEEGKWTEPKVLKGNSLADRLRHDPE